MTKLAKVSAAIIAACAELSLPPHRFAKVSGIGCSSKTPAYFVSQAHGFNSVHGRMPSVTTGANAANRKLTYIGVSGDGDSLSIAVGQFVQEIAPAREDVLSEYKTVTPI